MAKLFLLSLLAVLLGFGQTDTTERPARFDKLVRADFFAGFAGDTIRLLKAMEACERTLADNPKHAEALVWHGSGLLFQAGVAFTAGDMGKGGELWTRGLKGMSEAVALAPDQVTVLIPRGATLLQASRNAPGPSGRALLEQGLADYEKVLALQASYFHTIGDHPRGELLFGLAEGYGRLGRPDKARMYFERIVNEVAGSGQAPRAEAWLKTGVLPGINGSGCVGCHR
jgi:tetratricopeptide (TPR) repeat protein